MRSLKVFFDREKDQFIGITDEIKSDLSKRYPNVNIDHELFLMEIWLLTTSKGLKTKGALSFIANWLNRSQAKHLNPIHENNESVNEYLEVLWKEKESLLKKNES